MEVGGEMNAKYTILTHFSQKEMYKIAQISDNIPDNVGIAFDLMRFHWGNVHIVPQLIPLLKSFYPKDVTVISSQGKLLTERYESMDRSKATGH